MFKIFAKSRIPYGVRGDEIDKVDISEVSDDIWIEIGGWPSWFEFWGHALRNDGNFLYLPPVTWSLKLYVRELINEL